MEEEGNKTNLSNKMRLLMIVGLRSVHYHYFFNTLGQVAALEKHTLWLLQSSSLL